jgi:hypothetical protein
MIFGFTYSEVFLICAVSAGVSLLFYIAMLPT